MRSKHADSRSRQTGSRSRHVFAMKQMLDQGMLLLPTDSASKYVI